MNIYVGNLAYSVSEAELREVFAEFGEVSSVNVITDKFTGQSKGFAFVEMPNNSEADKAIKALNESELKGRNIKVNQARPRSERGGGDRGDRGERSARRPRY
jgi:RNA recognition motif-containing protein